MNAAVLPLSLVSDLVVQCEESVLRNVSDGLSRWNVAIKALRAFETEALLDNPSPKDLARHKGLVTRLISLGKVIGLTALAPEFPDKKAGAMLSATLSMLEDDLTMWHGKTPKAERERICQRIFGES